jgi:tRNA nucleotidyltransferase (CCA-adding enzyme)
VEHHLKPSQFFAQGAKAGAIRRLATKVNIEELVLVAEADYLGRWNREQGVEKSRYPAGAWLLERAGELHVKKNPLRPLIQGRDLIAMGLKPSPRFKEILDEVYQLQMDGVFHDRTDAMVYIRKKYINSNPM